MPSDKKPPGLFEDMSIAYVDNGLVVVQDFSDEDSFVAFLDEHLSDPIKPLALSGKPIPLEVTIESKKVIVDIKRAS